MTKLRTLIEELIGRRKERSMCKKYSDFMDEITPDELYDRFIEYGLFSGNLPPIFDAASFLEYCKDGTRGEFADKWYQYATYDSMRNINIPRPIGIPVPMGYEHLCACLRDNWSKLQSHFRATTKVKKYIVSRIHIRKMRDTKALFEMNYQNWRVDGTPEPELLIGKRYVIRADISSCYPSIYTHAIPWALVGRDIAKTNTKSGEWYNQIDHFAQRTKNGETHGILIGPHTSNVLSEIILCKIDEKLCPKWDYVRNIDDYCCYVKTREEADEFLIDLNQALREYDLLLNHKKTVISELPTAAVEQWIHQIQDKAVYFGKFQKYVNYREVQKFMDYCIELMSKNKDNASILLYGLKILQHFNLTPNAKENLMKTAISLSLLYPYVVPLLDKFVFDTCNTDEKTIEKYINLIYEQYVSKNGYEACAYALYYAVKYNSLLKSFDVDKVIEKKDCIFMLLALIYCRKQKDAEALKRLKEYATKLKDNDELEEYWPFAYECLSVDDLEDDWKRMKRANVSFLKEMYR